MAKTGSKTLTPEAIRVLGERFGGRTGGVEKDCIIRKRMEWRGEQERCKGDFWDSDGPSRRDRHNNYGIRASEQIKLRWKCSAGDLRGRSSKLWRSRIKVTFQEWKNDKSKALNGMRTAIVNI